MKKDNIIAQTKRKQNLFILDLALFGQTIAIKAQSIV